MTTYDTLVAGSFEWMLTYALHSTALLALTAVATHAWLRSETWRDTLWRSAIVGPVLTATLVTLLPVTPLAGRLELPAGAYTSFASEAATAEPAGLGAEVGAGLPQPERSDALLDAVPAGKTSISAWRRPLLLLWAGGAALLLAGVLGRNLFLFARLRDREQLVAGPLVELLEELRRCAGVWRRVRLSVSPACATPLVTGGAEICLPPQFADRLDPEQQRAALAHELAHIQRRDPYWQLGLGLLNAALFFQPLNLLARRRIAESSEYLCDDWVVRQTGSGIALGRCLAEVASWTAAEPSRFVRASPAIAEGGSPLLQRIRRIADDTLPRAQGRALPAVAAVAALLLTMAVVPGVVAIPSVPQAGRNPDVELLENLALRDRDPQVRQEAAASLSDIGGPAAEEALMRLARGAPDPIVRSEAAQQLDEFPTDRVVEVLFEVIFADSVADVRESAFYTLEDFALPSAPEALRRLARQHPDPDLRGAAIDALTDGESATPTE